MSTTMAKCVGMGEDCVRLAERVVDQLLARQTDLAGLSALMVARASQSMESAAILGQAGFNGDAMSVARTIVELAIDLAYIVANNPADLIPKYEAHDDVRAFQLAEAVDRMHGGGSDRVAMHTLEQRRNAALANDPNTEHNWAGISLRRRAAMAGASQDARDLHVRMYEVLYADMCGASHSGYPTLWYTLTPRGLRFGRQEPACKPVELAFGALFGLVSTAAGASGVTEFEDDFARLRAAMVDCGSPDTN